MQVLVLDNNRLASLPSAIGLLQHLEKLTVSHNVLTSMPTSTKQLLHLRVLDISSNRLPALPDSIAECEALEDFNASDNRLQVSVYAMLLAHGVLYCWDCLTSHMPTTCSSLHLLL